MYRGDEKLTSITAFQWTREPKNYDITDDRILITTEPNTDL